MINILFFNFLIVQEAIISITSLIIAIISAGIAIWQWILSKQQLEQAKNTKNETDKLLSIINEKVNKIELISDETRKDIKEQISKMIDKNDENFKELLKNSSKSNEIQMVSTLAPLMQNPELFNNIIQLWENMNKDRQ